MGEGKLQPISPIGGRWVVPATRPGGCYDAPTQEDIEEKCGGRYYRHGLHRHPEEENAKGLPPSLEEEHQRALTWRRIQKNLEDASFRTAQMRKYANGHPRKKGSKARRQRKNYSHRLHR